MDNNVRTKQTLKAKWSKYSTDVIDIVYSHVAGNQNSKLKNEFVKNQVK